MAGKCGTYNMRWVNGNLYSYINSLIMVSNGFWWAGRAQL